MSKTNGKHVPDTTNLFYRYSFDLHLLLQQRSGSARTLIGGDNVPQLISVPLIGWRAVMAVFTSPSLVFPPGELWEQILPRFLSAGNHWHLFFFLFCFHPSKLLPRISFVLFIFFVSFVFWKCTETKLRDVIF